MTQAHKVPGSLSGATSTSTRNNVPASNRRFAAKPMPPRETFTMRAGHWLSPGNVTGCNDAGTSHGYRSWTRRSAPEYFSGSFSVPACAAEQNNFRHHDNTIGTMAARLGEYLGL